MKEDKYLVFLEMRLERAIAMREECRDFDEYDDMNYYKGQVDALKKSIEFYLSLKGES